MQKQNVLALIPARGGSKGLPRKNILQVGGRPLIAWTIAAAMQSDVIDRVVLSSDDDEIIKSAHEWGCETPFKRPAELAKDSTTSLDVAIHALDQLPDFDYLILLQPTSPLRSAEDIDAAFAQMKTSGAPSCVSVCEVEQSPYWMYALDEEKKLHSLIPTQLTPTRRQDLPSAYVLNGAIYIAKSDWLRKTMSFLTEETVAYVMNKSNSIDIDTPEDFEAFRKIINEKA